MAFDIQINDELVRIDLHDRVCDQDLQGVFDAAHLIESTAKVTPHRLTDMSGVKAVKLGFFAMEKHASRRRIAQLRNVVKSAIVAPEPLHYGFARMFQSLNTNPQIQLRLFREVAAAEQWIQSPTA